MAATRIWSESPTPTGEGELISREVDPGDEDAAPDERGFMDILAVAEEQAERLGPALEAIGNHILALGRVAEESTAKMADGDARGRGMRGRLQVATRYASALGEIATELESDSEQYITILDDVSAGNLALIQRFEEEPSQLDDPSAMEFAMVVRQVARATRDSMVNLAGLVSTVSDTAKLSRVMREPSQRLTRALNRYADATGIVDEWDRRLQALGVPMPPEEEQQNEAASETRDPESNQPAIDELGTAPEEEEGR